VASHFPRLGTARLSLEPITDADVATLVRHFSEAHVQRYLRDDQPASYERVNAVVSVSDRDFRQFGYGIWAVHLIGTEYAIGMCGLQSRRGQPGVELLFGLRPRYMRQGYALEATAAVMEFARKASINPIVAIVSSENAGARAVLNSLGLTVSPDIKDPHGDVFVE
jgi:[ribosomal protein S5]-alanine N-acetyltransferase